ncbi:MAG TPA: inorganic diphosphatase [Clostridiaceae bacterium]|nr:inorganic diphosphatase [Clostridiaceae bacterium]
MSAWNQLPDERLQPDNFIAVIEIPKGSKQKYEIDESTGLLRLDRILYTSTHYPANYGFVPRTLAADGDPLDVLVLCSETLVPMCMVQCFPIGLLSMKDDNKTDEKLIAVPFKDPQMSDYNDLNDLPPHVYNEMEHFFSVYKELEGIETDIMDICGRKEAEITFLRCREEFEKSDDISSQVFSKSNQ